LGAVVDDRADRTEVRVDEDPPGHATGTRDLLDHEDDVEEGTALATVIPGDRHPHEPGLHEVLDVLPGIFLALVPARRPLAELPDGERAGPRSKRLLVRGQRKSHPVLHLPGGVSWRQARL